VLGVKKELGGPETTNIYELGLLEEVTGRTLRPGGFVLTEQALELCRFTEGATILDIGCGSGATVQLLREKYNLNALGIDISEKMIKTGKCISPDLPLMQADASNLPFSANEFDGVFLECSFSLFSDRRKVLTEIHRVLKTEGKIVISDFYYQNRPGKTKEDMLGLLDETGFAVEYWQKKSDYLAQLLADCILSGKPAELLWNCLLAKEDNKCFGKEEIKKWKPDYFLLIGKKV